jgi:hypothetical protein
VSSIASPEALKLSQSAQDFLSCRALEHLFRFVAASLKRIAGIQVCFPETCGMRFAVGCALSQV